MDDDSSHNWMTNWTAALRLGSHTFPSTLLMVAVALVAAFTALPPLFFIFGTGWFAPFVLALALFMIAMLFKNIFLKSIYKNKVGDGDTALLEYLCQQNTTE